MNLLVPLLLLAAVASVSAVPLAHPEDEKATASGGTATEAASVAQCQPAQFAEFETKQTHCFTEAEVAYNETIKDEAKLTPEEVKKGICKSVTDKVHCITTHLPLCHNAVQTEAVKDQFLISEFQGKYYDSRTRPFPEFVASCPVLKDNEVNVVKLMTGGPNSCTFAEIQQSTSNDSLAAWAKCNVDTVEEYNKLLVDLESDTNEKVIQAYCARKKLYEAHCRDPYVKCQSPDAHLSLRQSEKALFDQVEQLIKGHKLPDFSFEKSCTN